MNKESKQIPCATCSEPVFYESCTSDKPASPEMVCCLEWFGVFEGDDGLTRIVACCSESCVRQFFAREDVR